MHPDQQGAANHVIMCDGSRHFGELPQSALWEELRAHLEQLQGVVITTYLADHVTEAWIDFTYRGHRFSMNDQFRSYWFFVDDPDFPERLLRCVLDHCRKLLR